MNLLGLPRVGAGPLNLGAEPMFLGPEPLNLGLGARNLGPLNPEPLDLVAEPPEEP